MTDAMASQDKPRSATALLAGLILLNLLVAALGGLFTAASVRTWYPELVKPSWNPPSWIFGPVWTVLYLMIAVAAWQAIRSAPPGARRSVTGWYLGQLALNARWSPLFFGLRNPGLGLIGIVLLDIAAVCCAVRFRATSRLAFTLFLPYLAWILFATFLNATLWQLNV